MFFKRYKIGINFFYTYLDDEKEGRGGKREIFFWFGLIWCNDSWKLELDG